MSGAGRAEPSWKAVYGWACPCRGEEMGNPMTHRAIECSRRRQIVTYVPTYPDVPVAYRRNGAVTTAEKAAEVGVGRIVATSDQPWFGEVPRPVRDRAARIRGSRITHAAWTAWHGTGEERHVAVRESLVLRVGDVARSWACWERWEGERSWRYSAGMALVDGLRLPVSLRAFDEAVLPR